MEKSFKKLSMMVMLACTIGYSLNANTQGVAPDVTTIKVTNMGGNQYIGVDSPHFTKQKPIDNDNNYKFSSGHSYYLMVYTDCIPKNYLELVNCPAYYWPSQTINRDGKDFIGSEGGEWNVQTNEITVKATTSNSLKPIKKTLKKSGK